MSGRRIVIFGCGYVGRELARRAVSDGHEVWIHSRNLESLAAVDEVPPSQRVAGDLHGDAWHHQLSGEWDAVFNLVSSAGGGIDGYRLSYIEGNLSIREWAGKVAARRFIYTSATSVYPQVDGEWVDENDVPSRDQLSASGQLLRQAEEEILASEAFPTRIVARLAGIYGPGRHLYLNRLREGAETIPGDGAAWLNLIHLKDIVDVLIRLMEVELGSSAEVVNVVDNKPSQKQAIVDWLATTMGVPSIPFDPAQQGGRAARRSVPGGLPNRRVRNDKLRALLDWTPRYPDFRAGYADILSKD